jgi:oligopeptidase B
VEHHGRAWDDPYAWLRSSVWQEVMRDPDKLEPDIRAYLEAENRYTEAALRPTEDLQRRLFEEYRGRIQEDDSTVPADDGPWSYYARYRVGGQHPIFCRRPRGAEGPETVLFDGDAEAQGKAFFEVAACEPSPGHGRACVATDESGAELWTLRFKDLATDAWLEDRIERTSGSFVFVDDDTVLYTVLDAQHRPRTVKRHVLGTAPATDPVMYHEEDPGFFVGLDRSESERFAIVDAHDHETSEVRLLDTSDPLGALTVVAVREKGIEYDVSHHGERLVIRTNAQGAEDYALATMPLSAVGVDTSRESWRELIPHEPGRLRLAHHLFSRHLVVLERLDGLPRLTIYELDGEALGVAHEVAFEEAAYALSLHGSREFDTTRVRFGYSSLTTPSEVYDYDMASRERSLRKRQKVPSGHDPSKYRSHRLMVKSHDGEEVPVSVLHHAETPLDGSAPLFLYGYGAYGHAIPASFGVTRLSLVDRGVVFAIAHVRGGMDRGYRWYRDGKLARKDNTFHDFIAVAEGLLERGFGAPGKIVAHGGSAGGMLMGVIANRRPDLFHAIVADVPFVDVLNTMLDASLPLTPPEWNEWGHPLESPEALDRIRAYSPYDNVREGPYPHMLVLAGLTDPRVTYWEPAKLVARLRACKTDDNLLLLRTNMEAGHGGASGRFEALREVAIEHAFALWVLGRMDVEPRPST